ncbi:MAG: RNA 3'-terminal phosphate cyclase [Nitrososphaerales archaeon]
MTIDIDGSMGEGGGQILRTAVSLSAILGKPIEISNIRAGRKEPGLRPQHIQAISSAAEMCDGETRGVRIGSTSLEFIPGKVSRVFEKKIDTGTAGSVTLIAQTLIPISIFHGVEMNLDILGGTEVPNSPTIDYLTKIVCPIYRMLGAELSVDLVKRGYYPRGGGLIKVRCRRSTKLPEKIELSSADAQNVKILSSSRNLPEHVTKRQADSSASFLEKSGIKISSVTIDSTGESLSPGSSILVYSEGRQHGLIGSSALGERGRKAEAVGEEAANLFLKELGCRPAVDSHLADMLSTLLPCLSGPSQFTTPELTDHLKTNIKVCESMVEESSFEITPPKRQGEECFTVRVSSIRKV